MTPTLWAEGLAEVALAAVRVASDAGVPDAEAALVELEVRGGRSGVARAIVRELAMELIRQTRTELRLADVVQDQPSLAPPEWN